MNKPLDRETAYKVLGIIGGIITLHRSPRKHVTGILEVKRFETVQERKEFIKTMFRKYNIQRRPWEYFFQILLDDTPEDNEELIYTPKPKTIQKPTSNKPPAIYTNQSEWQRFVNTGS